jgi:hypothetical protein
MSIEQRTHTLICLTALLTASHAVAEEPALPKNFVSASIPRDLPSGAQHASAQEAAIFAWQEFIALNWPAAAKHRELADRSRKLDADAPRVWETFRGRVEGFPGTGKPFTKPSKDYDYEAPPHYSYDPEKVTGGAAPGEAPPCEGVSAHAEVPWNNLDEINHNHVRSSLSPAGPFPGQQTLLESKLNKLEYVYVAARGWYGDKPIRSARTRTGDYVRSKLKAPPPAARADDPDDTEYVSLPTGSIEVKAAWRRLGAKDDSSRFYSNRVRYYRSEQGHPCYVDSSRDDSDRWGLLAFHVMHKTPSAPYFVWATFEQVDVLVSEETGPDGKPVAIETPEGALTEAGARIQQTYTPSLELVPASETKQQAYRFGSAATQPLKQQLYFRQLAAYDIPAVPQVAINRRMYPISKTIQDVNRAAQAALRKAAPSSPLSNYRLVSVQWVPIDKKPGAYYEGPEDPSTYYAANVIIEGPPIAQAFSGQFSHGTSKSSDYLHRELVFLNPKPNPGAPVFLNTFVDGKGYLTGGCMGCHGTRQAYGTDWSFLLDRGRVKAPEIELDDALPSTSASATP